jgi:hypothetical protein
VQTIPTVALPAVVPAPNGNGRPAIAATDA